MPTLQELKQDALKIRHDIIMKLFTNISRLRRDLEFIELKFQKEVAAHAFDLLGSIHERGLEIDTQYKELRELNVTIFLLEEQEALTPSCTKFYLMPSSGPLDCQKLS